MPNRIKKAKELNGLFIYQDKYHGTVYYDIFTKNGYILSNDDIRYYTLSVAFIPLTVALFYFTTQFKIDTYISLLISLGFYIIVQLIFRFAFLYKLPCVENYNKERNENIFDNLISNYSKQRLLLIIIFLAALTVVTLIYILINNFKGIALIALWSLFAITVLFLLLILKAFIKNK